MTLPDIPTDDWFGYQADQLNQQFQSKINALGFGAAADNQIASLQPQADIAQQTIDNTHAVHDSLPDQASSPPPAPEPTPAPSTPSPPDQLPGGPGPTGSGGTDWIANALNNVQQAGGNVSQFASNLNDSLTSGAQDTTGAALNAAHAAGADVQQFASNFAPPPAPEPAPASAPTDSTTPAPFSVTQQPPSSGASDWISSALNNVQQTGGDVSQFASHLNDSLTSGVGDAASAALNAAQSAGADVGAFAQNFTPPPPPAPITRQFDANSAPDSGQFGAIDSTSRDSFARTFAPYAQYISQKTGIDPTLVTAMAGSESNFGKAPGNELFGIKALPGQASQSLMTHEGEYGGTNMNQDFAAYDSPLDSANAYINLITKHYPGAMGAQTAADLAHGLKAGGYFTAAEDEYANSLASIQKQVSGGVQAGLSGAQQLGQDVLSTGQTAVNTAQQAAQGAAARTSQFAMGLSSGDAMAFCGPAAAMAFAASFGRNPTVEEAKQLAASVGWNAGQGMAGPSSEVSLLNKLGIDAHMTNGVNWQQVAQDAAGGNPVILDTPGHYFYVDGYNPDTGQLHLGSSATDLKASGGQEWFAPDQIGKLGMGDVRAAIFADHPLTDAGAAAQQAGQYVGNLLDQGGSKISALNQQAQDTMSAVLNTGSQSAQDLGSNASSWLDQQRQNLSDSLSSSQPTYMDTMQPAGGTPGGTPPGGDQNQGPLDRFKQQLGDAFDQLLSPLMSGLGGTASDAGRAGQAALNEIQNQNQDVIANLTSGDPGRVARELVTLPSTLIAGGSDISAPVGAALGALGLPGGADNPTIDLFGNQLNAGGVFQHDIPHLTVNIGDHTISTPDQVTIPIGPREVLAQGANLLTAPVGEAGGEVAEAAQAGARAAQGGLTDLAAGALEHLPGEPVTALAHTGLPEDVAARLATGTATDADRALADAAAATPPAATSDVADQLAAISEQRNRVLDAALDGNPAAQAGVQQAERNASAQAQDVLRDVPSSDLEDLLSQRQQARLYDTDPITGAQGDRSVGNLSLTDDMGRQDYVAQELMRRGDEPVTAAPDAGGGGGGTGAPPPPETPYTNGTAGGAVPPPAGGGSAAAAAPASGADVLDAVRSMYEPRTGGPSVLDRLQAVRQVLGARAIARRFFDRDTDLAAAQAEYTRGLGRAIDPAEMMYELNRRNPGMESKVNLENNFAPIVRDAQNAGLLEDLATYNTLHNNVRVADQVGQDVQARLADRPVDARVTQRLNDANANVRASQTALNRVLATDPREDADRLVAARQALTDAQSEQTAARTAHEAARQAILDDARAKGQAATSARAFSTGNPNVFVDREGSARALEAMAQRMGPDRIAQLQDLNDRLGDFTTQLRQRLVDAGVLSQQQADTMAEKYPDWMKTRILDYHTDADTPGFGRGGKLGLADRDLHSYTVEGTSRARENPLASMVAYSHQVQRMADKNETFQALYHLDQRSGANELQRVASDYRARPGENVVQGFLDGQKVKLATRNQALAQAINREHMSNAPPWFQWLTRAFRNVAASRNPGFVATHAGFTIPGYMMRQSALMGGHPLAIARTAWELMRAYPDVFQGLFSGGLERAGPGTREFLERGGGHGFFGGEPGKAATELEDILHPNAFQIRNAGDLQKLMERAVKMEWIENLIQRVDYAPRVAAMRLGEQRGLSPLEAMIAGREGAGIDFDKGGSFVRAANQVIPFLNIGFQGPASVYDTFRQNPLGASAIVAQLIGAPTAGVEAYNRADPQRAQDYADVPQYVKDRHLVIMMPEGLGGGASAPVDDQGERHPQYAAIDMRNWAPFMSLTRDAMARGIYGDESRGLGDALQSAATTASPIPITNPADMVSRLSAGGGLGQLGSTIENLAMNRDPFRNSDIVTQRNDINSSDTAKALRAPIQALVDSVAPGQATIRPSAIDYAIKNTLAGTGNFILGGTDPIAAALTNQPYTLNRNAAGAGTVPILGGEIRSAIGGQTGETLNTARRSAAPPSMIQQLRQAGIPTWQPAPVGSSIQNVPLMRSEEARYQELTTQYSQEQLDKVMRSQSWQKAGTAQRQQMAQEAVSTAREKAANQVIRTIPAAERKRRMASQSARANAVYETAGAS